MVFYRIVIILFFILFSTNVKGQQPLKIISLAPIITKMIYLLDEENNLAGCTNYCDIAVKDHKNIVANDMEVNVEKILILQPDIVITTNLTKPTVINEIKKVGIKVKVYAIPDSYSDLSNIFVDMAKLLNKNSLAMDIIYKQQQRLDLIMKKIPGGKKVKIFFEIGTKPLFTVIPHTFMDDYIKYAGGVNIAGDLKNGLISKESVLTRNPDVIFIVTMGILTDEEISMWKNYHFLNAAKFNRVFSIDADKTCSPDPVTFVDVVDQMVKLIYK